ncbi:hypothetical protein [Pandoraea sp. 64-18]|uniref:hypothetical protein n=1 Tax=Pandoraea sp. 64-18 TaxID=1895806 RepID=UPI000B27A390|nr:hypothetical protein [Pandoraea sp. 64-18]
MDPGALLQAGVALVSAGVVYGAIRADLKAMHERVGKIEDRFNSHIDKGLTHGNT